jgi:hypothetical protein
VRPQSIAALAGEASSLVRLKCHPTGVRRLCCRGSFRTIRCRTASRRGVGALRWPDARSCVSAGCKRRGSGRSRCNHVRFRSWKRHSPDRAGSAFARNHVASPLRHTRASIIMLIRCGRPTLCDRCQLGSVLNRAYVVPASELQIRQGLAGGCDHSRWVPAQIYARMKRFLQILHLLDCQRQPGSAGRRRSRQKASTRASPQI